MSSEIVSVATGDGMPGRVVVQRSDIQDGLDAPLRHRVLRAFIQASGDGRVVAMDPEAEGVVV